MKTANNDFTRLNSVLTIFVVAIFTWLVVVPLMQDGMFSDGIGYAAVSRNLAQGTGTWWEPEFSQTFFNHFHQQPPLMLWLQSFFFRITGESIYPERIYCLLEGIIMLCLIGYSWKKLNPDPDIKHMTWLPQLLWLMVPIISWGLKNNLTENTMVIFDWLAVLFMIQFMEKKNEALNFLLASIFLFGASFTKGIQGLFPIAVPACYYLCLHKISFRKMLIITVSFGVTIATFYLFLFQIPGALESFKEYARDRLAGFPKTPTAATSNRLWLLSRIGIEVSVPLAFSLIVVVVTSGKNFLKNLNVKENHNAIFFICVGLTASIPLLISFEQRGFYLITSMPFFVMGIAIMVASSFKRGAESWSVRLNRYFLIRTMSILFLLSGIVFTFMKAGKIKRDQDTLTDVYRLRQEVGRNGIVGTSALTASQWSLQAYCARYANISLAEGCDTCRFYLQLKNEEVLNPSGYRKMNLETRFVDVYEKLKP